MIILDTHNWIWWTVETSKLKKEHKELIRSQQAGGLGVSAVSCWEIALLHAKHRVEFSLPLLVWLQTSLSLPNVILLPLSPDIAVEATQLPGFFHKDPADQLIVATARIYDCFLIVYDKQILAYPHVKLLP